MPLGSNAFSWEFFIVYYTDTFSVWLLALGSNVVIYVVEPSTYQWTGFCGVLLMVRFLGPCLDLAIPKMAASKDDKFNFYLGT